MLLFALTMIVNMPMKKIAAGSFKVHCLAVTDEVQSKRESVIITKRGKPVAKLVPIDKQTDDIFGFLAGKGEVTGNVVDSRYSVLRSTDRRP